MSAIYEPIDQLWLDWVYQPIGDWTHKRFGLHPQVIAEFFGMGGVIAEGIRQAILRGENPTALSVFGGCMLMAVQIYLFSCIHKPVRYNGGRNPKRFWHSVLRFFFFFCMVISLISIPMLKRLDDVPFWLDFANSAFFWIGLSFAAVDEPPPREYRKSVFGWAAS